MGIITGFFDFILSYLPGVILLVFVSGLFLIYVSDRHQVDHTLRRNYPVVGRLRYMFEEMGVFFRQYFFAQDREEMPFNRADRTWVYQAAKQESTLQAFGSTRLQHEGDVLFANSIFPYTGSDEPEQQVFGPYCPNPYATDKVFHISGMSFGAISKPAVKALVSGAREAGVWINTGEGGASTEHLQGGADVVYQIGTAKYGVRNADGSLSDEKLKVVAENNNVKMFEIKLSQGAKPGKGGILPADKVTAEIAAQRGIPEGKASISPPTHQEIQNFDDLYTFIRHIRSVTEKPVGIKLCLGNIVEFREMLAALINKASAAAADITDSHSKQSAFDDVIKAYAPDFITLDGGNGGTGAAPMSLIDAAGMNLQESLPLVSNLLAELNLKDRIKLVASGKLITPVDVAWALCAGADAVTTARGFMFSLGCIQALQCHKNSCPTGITTHDKRLQAGLDPINKSVRVAAYANEMHKELETIAKSCGVSSPSKLSRKNALIYTSNQHAKPMEEVYKC
ncbi:MAG: Ferredoxin-dependent glutamate synthase 2 [Marinobacterium sp. xm-d-530]|nr:MAG: Ferredoxin-dependent glutamate synthase 2 [Marinobacterium sp. xm-d-530]